MAMFWPGCRGAQSEARGEHGLAQIVVVMAYLRDLLSADDESPLHVTPSKAERTTAPKTIELACGCVVDVM
jgi:hypothetical protein